MSRDDIERSFEGQQVLQKLLTESGSIVDVEDLAAAFAQAASEGVPAPVVIDALWDDEPHFTSPDDAARLFGNLLGLYDLIASGKKVDLTTAVHHVKREKAQRPEAFGAEGPTDDFVESAWRWFDDYPKEREKFQHAFENRQDPLASWVDAEGLSDTGFGLALHLIGEVFAMLEAGGRSVKTVYEDQVPATGSLEGIPSALSKWIDEVLFDAQEDEAQKLSAEEAEKIRGVVSRAVQAMLTASA